MPDGPRRAMSRDPDSLRRRRDEDQPVEKCEKCGGEIREGDWPWCSGDPRAHER